MDITVIIRKTLVYSSVMGILASIYLIVIAVFARLFEGLTGYQTVFSSTIAAALIAFCFQPLKKRVQMLVDRKFFRSYVDREEKLYELSREVITHTTPEAMAQALMRVLQESLHPKVGRFIFEIAGRRRVCARVHGWVSRGGPDARRQPSRALFHRSPAAICPGCV